MPYCSQGSLLLVLTGGLQYGQVAVHISTMQHSVLMGDDLCNLLLLQKLKPYDLSHCGRVL